MILVPRNMFQCRSHTLAMTPTLYVRLYRRFDDPLPFKSQIAEYALLTAHSCATGYITFFCLVCRFLKKKGGAKLLILTSSVASVCVCGCVQWS